MAGGIILVLLGLAGLACEVPYSGWVLFVGLLISVNAAP
jgi:hypothetical protein